MRGERERRRTPLAPRQRPGLGDRRVRHAAQLHVHPKRPRVGEGPHRGRTHEISRLIGRSLRAVIDYKALGENTIVVDCDVLQADGGTRTAAITGAWVALSLALDTMVARGLLKARPRLDPLAAVSVGVVDGVGMLDLCYEEDARADVDMNVVMTGAGGFVEVQGTAERSPFDRAALDALLGLAATGITRLLDLQRAVLAEPPAPR